MVSCEFIRIVVFWYELWYEGLEEVFWFYFGDYNIKGMFDVFEFFYDLFEKGF